MQFFFGKDSEAGNSIQKRTRPRRKSPGTGAQKHRGAPVTGWGKLQLVGVQGDPADPAVVRMVEVISQKRITQIFHVNPDLMGASGFQVQLHQRKMVSRVQTFKMGDCFRAGLKIDLPLKNGVRFSGDGSADCAFRGADSLDQSQVGAPDPAFLYSRGQKGSAVGVFRQDQGSGGVPVSRLMQR